MYVGKKKTITFDIYTLNLIWWFAKRNWIFFL